MQVIDGQLLFSATDLNNYVECEHLLELERLVALGELVRPEPDATTELIARKGAEHEAQHVTRFRRMYGSRFVSFEERPDRTMEALRAAEARTLQAMEAGAEIIYQATFFDGTFVGYADFLRRIDVPSERFAWSYEVIDTKLALNPKPYFLVQLCNYSEHVARLTGTMPENMAIILGSGIERRFRVEDFAAYYRHLKASFLQRMQAATETYPVVCKHCVICPWAGRCERQRDRDDHLSIVAWMRKDQIAKLTESGVTTIAALATATNEQRPHGMAERTFENLRAQAALQHSQRTKGTHAFEFREIPEGDGFYKLPVPARGDVFFDMEGDPLYRPDRGLEYLFGVYLCDEDRYEKWWAKDGNAERAAFEGFMDFCAKRLEKYPDAHIYHYAPYETTALKRLAGRFASRGEQLDDFLRRGIFVDLFQIARQSLRISQPSYSIKKFEAFYQMQRSTATQRGDDSIVMFESWLVSGEEALLEDIERYNEDDCRSTYHLREWLRARMDEFNAGHAEKIPWRSEPESKAPQEEPERTELEQRLLTGIAGFDSLEDLRASAPDVRARWLLGNLLAYHRREAKPEWWKYFDRLANPNELEEQDREALAGLSLREEIAPYKVGARDRNSVYAYRYPPQEHNIGSKPVEPYGGRSAGDIISIDDTHGTLEIKLSSAIAPESLRALIPGTPIPTKLQRGAIERVAQAYVSDRLASDYPATLDLLLASKPRLSGVSVVQPASVGAAEISGRIRALDKSYLFVQGPPGSGKTTKAAHVIVDLLATGQRVGILANGHKAIHNLLRKVETEAADRGINFRGCHKESGLTEGSKYISPLESAFVESSSDINALADPACQLASGTPYAWSDPSLVGVYDYLFIDEAGQISIADALGCSLAARNIVLLGDPLQLKQVSQASHPIGTDLSILQHLLGEHLTIPPDRGIFLDVSHRMHPEICSFLSHVVYEDRLHADAATRANSVESASLHGSGLRFLGIEHSGNGRKSSEEADTVVREITALLDGEVTVASATGGPVRRRFSANDVLVVSPYNAQRKLITERLEKAELSNIRVGTVDKFQGQEAPVVFYSMATSSGEDIPRDVEFLFEKNRLNVAISRAQCMSVLVCSPRLLELRCSNPEQMALANLLCAFVESAGKREAPAFAGA